MVPAWQHYEEEFSEDAVSQEFLDLLEEEAATFGLSLEAYLEGSAGEHPIGYLYASTIMKVALGTEPHTPHKLFVVSKDGIYVQWVAREGCHHFNDGNYIGKSLIEVLPKGVGQAVLQTLQRSIQTRKGENMIFNLPMNQGRHARIKLFIVPMTLTHALILAWDHYWDA